MTTLEKNIRAAAIICHLNAIADKCPRPTLHTQDDLAQATTESLLEGLKSLFADIYPNNDECAIVLRDFNKLMKK